MSVHDLAVALGIATDLVTPIPRPAFEERRGDVGDYLTGRLRIDSPSGPCPADLNDIDYKGLPESVTLVLVAQCPTTGERISVTYDLLFEIDADHIAAGRITVPAGGPELVFDRLSRDASFETTAGVQATASVFGEFLLLGARHIVLDWDHPLFLFTLLLGVSRPLALVKIVTAFTLAHSLTLALAWFDVVRIAPGIVEPLIALSIVIAALFNLSSRLDGLGWRLAAVFGLIHGLGFYGVLADLDPAGFDPVPVLIAFNLGVEAGQLAIVPLFALPLVWLARQPWRRAAVRALSAGIMALALAWTAVRIAPYVA